MRVRLFKIRDDVNGWIVYAFSLMILGGERRRENGMIFN